MAALDQYDTDIHTAAQQYNVPEPLLRNLLMQENGGKPLGTSSKGARGIAQMMGPTARALGVNPNDPHQAIPGAAQYLSQLHARFGNWDQALAAYNAGPGNVHEAIQKGGENWQAALPKPRETIPYVKAITDVPGYDATAPDAGLNYDPVAAAAQASSTPSSTSSYDPVAAAEATQGALKSRATAMTPQQEAAARAKDVSDLYNSMDFPQRTLVNAGAALTSLGRGVAGLGAMAGQALGIPGAAALRQNLLRGQAEQNEAMAPATLRDPATWVGNALPYLAAAPLGVAGGAARGIGAMAARGALAGGALAALQEGGGGPGQSIGSELAQRGENALGGAALGAAGGALGGVPGAVRNALRSPGAEWQALAEKAAGSGAGPVASIQHPASVPEGYQPSLAEQTGNAQLIRMQRAVAGQPDFVVSAADNQAALNKAWRNLRGTPEQVAQAQKTLQANAEKWYGAARASLDNPTGAVDGQGLNAAYQDVLAQHADDPTVQGVLQKYAQPNKGTPGFNGNTPPSSPFQGVGGASSSEYLTDPHQLVQVRNQINADLDKQFTTDEAGTVAKRAAPALMQLRNAVDGELAQVSPAYAEANTLYSQAKAPINRMRLLQSVSNTADPTGNGDVTTAMLKRALGTVTGTDNDAGYALADDVDPQARQDLQDLYLTAARRDAVASRAQVGALSPETAQALQATGMMASPQSGANSLLPGAARAAGWATGNPAVGDLAGRVLGGVSNALTNPSSPAKVASQDALREAMTNYLLNNPEAQESILSQMAAGTPGNVLSGLGNAVTGAGAGDAAQAAYQYNPLAPQPQQAAQ